MLKNLQSEASYYSLPKCSQFSCIIKSLCHIFQGICKIRNIRDVCFAKKAIREKSRNFNKSRENQGNVKEVVCVYLSNKSSPKYAIKRARKEFLPIVLFFHHEVEAHVLARTCIELTC